MTRVICEVEGVASSENVDDVLAIWKTVESLCPGCYIYYPQTKVVDSKDENMPFSLTVKNTESGWKVVDGELPILSLDSYRELASRESKKRMK